MINQNTEKEIKIVDDIMGSGKSTWAINFINANKDKKFLCIVLSIIFAAMAPIFTKRKISQWSLPGISAQEKKTAEIWSNVSMRSPVRTMISGATSDSC